MRVALFTTIYGNYDNFNLPIKQVYPMDFIYFTENSVEVYDLCPNDSETPKLINRYPALDLWTIPRQIKKPETINLNKMNSILLRADHHNNLYLVDYDL